MQTIINVVASIVIAIIMVAWLAICFLPFWEDEAKRIDFSDSSNDINEF